MDRVEDLHAARLSRDTAQLAAKLLQLITDLSVRVQGLEAQRDTMQVSRQWLGLRREWDVVEGEGGTGRRGGRRVWGERVRNWRRVGGEEVGGGGGSSLPGDDGRAWEGRGQGRRAHVLP